MEQARLAIAARFGIPVNERLNIRAVSSPFDFLIKVPDHGVYQEILASDRTVVTPAFSLLLRPWSRLVNADQGALYHRVQIEIEGIPLHVWETPTAAALLRPYCSMESTHPDSELRRDGLDHATWVNSGGEDTRCTGAVPGR